MRRLLLKTFSGGSGQTVQDAELRRALVETLYTSPVSLATGALAGIVLSAAIAHVSRDSYLIGCALLLSLIAVVRVVSGLIFFRRLEKTQRAHSYRRWATTYEAGAAIYAGSLGLLAFTSLIRTHDHTVHLISVSLAMTYAAAAAGRNAGRVKLAVAQSCLSILPSAAGLWLVGDFSHRILALAMVGSIFGLADSARTTHGIVMQALRTKQQKTRLATKFEKLASYDSLTGLENRMAIQMRLRDMFQGNYRNYDAMAILWLDLDRFKEINDTLGHVVGDTLLCTVAQRLGELVGARGYISRFGGDEFVILCPDTNRFTAQKIANEIVEDFSQGVQVSDHLLQVTASVGLAVGPQDGRDAEELIQHADLALCEAKSKGGNRSVSFNWTMKERFHRAHEIETGLRRAIENDELLLHFQPIFDAHSGRIKICEALLRWDHPTLGRVSPAEFVPIAESINMIGPITEWVIGKACTIAADWPEDVRLAVNISPSSLHSGELPRIVIAALMQSGFTAKRLELEVTESIFLHGDGQTHQMLQALRQIGLRLVLDDFGTGYSSLGYLRDYHFDGIKIDRCFMSGIVTSRTDQAIVEAVGHLAASLDMEIVAEGIETAEELKYARDAGIHNVQGFLMSRPQPASVVGDMLRRGVTIGDAMTLRLREQTAMRA